MSWGAVAGAVVGGVASGMAGGDEGGSGGSTGPWIEAYPQLREILKDSAGLYGRTRDLPMYPGQTYADRTPLQNRATEAQMNMGNWYGAGLLPSASQGVAGLAAHTTQEAQARSMSPLGSSDPTAAINQALTGQVDTAAYDPIADAITQRSQRNLAETLPATAQAAVHAGAKGSSREGVAEGIARRGQQESLDSALSSLYGQAYGTAQNRASQATDQAIAAQKAQEAIRSSMTGQAGGLFGQLPGMAAGNLQVSQVPMQAGQTQQDMRQKRIDESIQRYNYPEAQYAKALDRYAGTVSPLAGAGSQTQSSGQGSNQFGQILGGALSGSQIGGLFGTGGQVQRTTYPQGDSGPYGYNTGGGMGSNSVNSILAQQNLWG